ncbi:AraC family ligand binding domain-containing protein [Corallibacter sp.]|uniref:AraC family ligand binding domain-containing protein n=1 Tax=Corallibacter sp. TaxID=2038084 RepID=UPI003AB5B1F1
MFTLCKIKTCFYCNSYKICAIICTFKTFMKIPILNISQFKKHSHRNDVYINTFSNHIKRNKNLINKPHSHNFYLCVLFTKGTGTHEIDFNSYTITPGKIFFFKTRTNTFLEI